MQIIIPTYGRGTNLTTLSSLPKHIKEWVTVVVQEREAHLWRDSDVLVQVLPEWVKTVGPTRQWIINNYQGKVCIMDDDLVFATRRKDDLGKFTPSTAYEICDMLAGIDNNLDEYPVVGLCPREGGNRKTNPTDVNTRVIRVTGLDLEVLKKHDVRYDRLPVMEDFDMLLQMLELGYSNVCLNKWVHNQGGSNSAGGCSTYRTEQLQTEAANGLHELHKPFVKVVKKKTKTAWGGGERTDVIIQWKKAGKFGQSNLLDQRKVQSKAS